MNNENLKPVQELSPFTKMIMTIGTLPTSFYSSMSYYESMVWLYEYLKNEVIPTVNNNGEAVEELQAKYIELKSYIDNYFENLDVQEEINNKLDEMALDGTLTNLIKNYVDPIQEAYEGQVNQKLRDQDDEISTFKNTINGQITDITGIVNNFDTKLSQATNGSPLSASSTSEMTDTSKIYVNTTDGKWYYYDGDSWEIGGTYQSAVEPNSISDSQHNVNFDLAFNSEEFFNLDEILINNLIKVKESIDENFTSKIIGLNELEMTNISGASYTGRISLTEDINLKASTQYTLILLDYMSTSSTYFYPVISGTTTILKDVNNTSIEINGNSATQNNIKRFTTKAETSIVNIQYTPSNIASTYNSKFRLLLIEGDYTLNDLRRKSILDGRTFINTINKSSSPDNFKNKVFYLTQGVDALPNFNISTLSPTKTYIIYNNISGGQTTSWGYIDYFLNPAMITRQSIMKISPATTFNFTFDNFRYVWGIASEEGTYTIKDDQDNYITLAEGETAILSLASDTANKKIFWVKETIPVASKEYVDNLIPDNIESYVNTWLVAHPEATTTVQDGSITLSKLDTNLSNKANRVRVDSASSSTYQDNNNDLNTIIGANNMPNGIGSRNTIVGIDNLINANASRSPNREIAIGYHSLFRDWNGSHNVSIGNESMDNLSHGTYNASLGSNALRVQKVADYGGETAEGETINYNTAIGGNAMFFTYGDNNTAIGYEALKGNTYGANGSGNVAIGKCAGKYNTNESNHLYIDDRDRSSRENEIAKSLVYGTFADDITNQEFKINGKFSCNGATPQSSVLANANASDLQSAINLVNQIKEVLIANGIMK